MSEVALLLRNRARGAQVEEWAATFLAQLHSRVRVVGGHHGGIGLDCMPYDIEADGLRYEVKSCLERVQRMGVSSGTQPGRWKIDTLAHDAMDPIEQARTMYLLVVLDEHGPKHAYLCSHAKMTQILQRYRRQGRYVSVTTSVWTQRLARVYVRRRRTGGVSA